MAVNWSAAPEVQEVAEQVIRKFHRHLLNNGVEIKYRYRDDEPMSGGKLVYGKIEKVGPKQAFDVAEAAGTLDDLDLDPIEDSDEDEGNDSSPAARSYYRLWVSKPLWDGLGGNAKEALVDHFLCASETGKDKHGVVVIKLRAPDAVVYYPNLARYGTALETVRKVAQSLQEGGQQRLDLGVDPAVPVPVVNAGGEVVPASLAESAMRAAVGVEAHGLVIVEGGTPDVEADLNEHPVGPDGEPVTNVEIAATNGNGKHEGQEPGVEGFKRYRAKKKAEASAGTAA